MANVIFKQGTRAQYDAIITKDSNTLYWLSDTQELYKGDVLYGIGAEATEKAAGLMSAADKAKLDALVTGNVAGLTPVDASVVLDTGDGGTTIGVRISGEEGNALELKEDGLFVSPAVASDSVEFTIEAQETPEDGYAATYKLKRTEGESATYVGDAINIPKDAVLTGGTYEIVEAADDPYDGAEVGDPYVDLIVANAEKSHIYIPLKGLVDTVKAGAGIMVENNTVSIKLDEDNANGLAVNDSGLSLTPATALTAGAMSAADKKFLDAVPTLYDAVQYEFSSLLDGTRVSHQGKEYRVMFPADAAWKKQENDGSNSNYNANNYYFAMKAYAPNDSVVGFKESTGETITDDKLYQFTKEDFGGVDAYGRKYSIVWLPAAVHDDSSDEWTYHGAKSGNGKYVGWYYTVEWYDAEGNVVASDTIRINLTNEDCHNSIKPFYMNDYSGLVWNEM